MQGEITKLTAALADKVIYPLIALLAAAGLLIFIYGVVEYLLGLSDVVGNGKERGKRHMFYGVIGLFIIIGSWAILSLIGQVMCNGSISNCAGGSSTFVR